MSLRFVDFKCQVCGLIYEEMVHGNNRHSSHCGRPSRSVLVSAPGLGGVSRHYSHTMGREVTYKEEETELAKTGSWIASKTEANRVYDGADFSDDVTVKKQTRQDYQVATEAALRALKNADAVNADGSDKYPNDPVKMEQIAFDTSRAISVPDNTTE